MPESNSVADRFLGDYLYIELPATFVIVGVLPAGLLDNSSEGLLVEHCEDLRQAEHVSAQQRHTSGSDLTTSTLALLLEIDADDEQLNRLLGRAVRAFPDRVVAHCQAPAGTSHSLDEMFFAFGFRKLTVLQAAHDRAAPRSWFEYRLSQYKTPPDWLNARFWANPERFDMDEDPDEYCEDDETGELDDDLR